MPSEKPPSTRTSSIFHSAFIIQTKEVLHIKVKNLREVVTQTMTMRVSLVLDLRMNTKTVV